MYNSKKNLDALSRLVGILDKQGPSYRPSNPAIESTALRALLEEAKKSIDAVHRTQVDLTVTISQRQSAFDQLPYVATRIGGAAKASGLTRSELEDLNMFKFKFRAQPFSNSAKAVAKTQGAPEGSVPPTRQNRQLGFPAKVMNFDILVKFLEARPAYKPTQADLTVDSLKAMLAELQAHNDAVQTARIALNEARFRRNKIIFGKTSGIPGIAQMVKEYMKAEFGFNSAEYKQINSATVKAK